VFKEGYGVIGGVWGHIGEEGDSDR
jgi:hypothetical protein